MKSGRTEARSRSGPGTGPDCSRLEKRFLEEERAKSERHFRQEYLCEFVEREGAAFSQESIDKAFQDFEPMKI